MRSLLLAAILFSLSVTGSAQVRSTDVDTPEHLVAAMYDVISGPAGQPRDWVRFRGLFAPDGRMVAIRGKAGADSKVYATMTPDQYVERNAPFMKDHGFVERGVSNRVEEFGSIAHVWSTYESRHAPGDKEPFARGINSITMVRVVEEGKPRWAVLQILWDSERPETPLPAKYGGGK